MLSPYIHKPPYSSFKSGYQYDRKFPSNSNVTFTGERKVERLVQSKNAMTHSFTIMPIVSASGELISPLYIVLQEKTGDKFGTQVAQNIFQCPNISVSCSKSGKMGKKHLEEWVSDVLVPATGDSCVLVVDSWSTFTEDNIRRQIPLGKQVTDFKYIQRSAT